jgi:predicted DNA-binding transcriptional regulator YafY
LFGILTHLQSKKYVTAENIANKFNISVRTVYRDIKALCEQGIPVSFEQHKGYFVVQGFFLPPVSFSTDEANALMLSERIVYGFTDTSIQQHYSTALGKVKAVMRGSDKDKLEHLNDRMLVQVPECINYTFGFLTVLQQSISARTIIEIDYKDKKEELSKRYVEPIGLIFYALNWHIIGWCHTRKDYRDFRVSRIVALKDTEKGFAKQDHIELNEYMKSLPVNY